MKKYKLIDETIQYNGVTLYRIEALIDFSNVKADQKGGFVASEKNLSDDDLCWVSGNAKVYGDAKISHNSDYIVFKNWWSSGRYFTWTRSNNKWKVGCFYGTGDELIEKAYKDSAYSGREYERVVRYVNSILAERRKKK